MRQLKTDIDLKKYIRHFHKFLKINHAIFLLTAIWTHMSRTLTSHNNFCKSKHAQEGVTRVAVDIKELYMKKYWLRFYLPILITVAIEFQNRTDSITKYKFNIYSNNLSIINAGYA